MVDLHAALGASKAMRLSAWATVGKSAGNRGSGKGEPEGSHGGGSRSFLSSHKSP
jgi:hypothetical protein